LATTRVIPLHIGKGRTIKAALGYSIDYVENPDKTENGELISSYECDIKTAESEFMLSKREYASLTGRSQGDRDVIAYHVRQSFKLGEITPEEANRIGYELAMRFTKGRHAFIICTHTDRKHIHNHLLWNSTDLDCRKKFRNFIGSAFALRRCNDLICAENGLSVIENPKPSPGNDYGRYMFPGRPPSFQQRLKTAIDSALEQKPPTFEDFLSIMRSAGYEVNTGRKHITFKATDQTRPTRCDTLRGDYTELAIRERIAGKRLSSSPTWRITEVIATCKPSLLIDIQTKMQQGKGAGYERWAKHHNLKQMAQMLIYLQEKGLDDYSLLKEKTAAALTKFNELAGKIKEFEAKLSANTELQKQIINYSKTRNTYVEYRKAGYSKKFKESHEADILIHQTAKKYFDGLGLAKLPTVALLREEYAPILAEKRKTYSEYKAAKAEMRELSIALNNVNRLFNISDERSERERERDIQR